MIRSVQRACDLIGAFTVSAPRLTLAELSSRAGLPKPTVHRLATTLVEAGFMVQHQDGRYGLGVRLMEVGAIARGDLDLIDVCTPVMEQLAARTEETVLLGVADWDALAITIVHRIDSSHELSVLSRVGRRSKLAPGALGKALLQGLAPPDLIAVAPRVDLAPHTERTIAGHDALIAEIDSCRAQGYATESGEYLDGVSAVAAPVVIAGERPVAAIAVVGPSTRLDERLHEIGASIRDRLAQLNGAS